MEGSAQGRKALVIAGGLLLLTALFLTAGCTGPRGTTGTIGGPGTTGANGVTGPAGAVGKNGTAGKAGPVGPVGAIGPTGNAGPPGDAGPQGVPAGVDPGMALDVSLSSPPTGKFFTAGQKIVVTITLNDAYNGLLTQNDFATLALYMDGPQDPTKTVAAVKLLHTTDNRSAPVHHYVDLLTNNSTSNGTSDLKINGNVLTYTLQPITDELPGTYSVALRAVKKGATTINQAMILGSVQIGTATAEQPTVNLAKCGACHQGASNNQIYMHHVDGSTANPLGSFSIDNGAIATCKECHNNNGYASYAFPLGSSTTISDQIVNRVHGVHMGAGLQLAANINPATGAFKNYIDVVFPQDVRNCTACHTNDNWKNKPSRLACGTCHDSTWFGDQNAVPAGYQSHSGGIQTDDTKCTVCHTSDNGPITTAVAPIPTVHQVSWPENQVDIAMTPPANGKYYAAGEKPVVTLVVHDDNGNVIDPTTISAAWRTASLFVYGPREQAKPVLTTAAKLGSNLTRATITSTIAGPWNFAAGDTFKIAVNGGTVQTLTAPVGNQTAAQVVAWLQANLTGVTVAASGSNVNILSSNFGAATSQIAIYNSAVTSKMGWKRAGVPLIKDGTVIGMTSGVTVEPYIVAAQLTTSANNLLPSAVVKDPAATVTNTNISYQLDDVAGLQSGTYMVMAYFRAPAAGLPNFKNAASHGLINFQIGTATVDKQVASGCTSCHGNNIWHQDNENVPFNTDWCLACHDYGRSGTGDGWDRLGGTTTSGYAGFGAKPLTARVHGVHFGNYLNHPEAVVASQPNAFNGVILPQDVRNCVKCHTSDTSGTWMTEPSRLACLSCHDGDAALAHGKVNTLIGPSGDSYGPDAVETCKTCHAPGKIFPVDVVHNISNPYVPPYPRQGWTIGQ